jgi:hypothetical protein
MPGINLEALNTGDLRRLLKVAHDRHDGPLADRLEWEIAARATSAARTATPFATLPEEEPEEPGFRMTATDDAPIVPGSKGAVWRDPEIRTFARQDPEPEAPEFGGPEPDPPEEPEALEEPWAPERIAEATAPAWPMPEAQATDRSPWWSIGLAALVGCLVAAAVFLAGAKMGERTALKRLAPAQEAALAPEAAPLTGWPDPMQVGAAPTPSLAPLQQAFAGIASPPGVKPRPVAGTQGASKKAAKKRWARASAPESEAVTNRSTKLGQGSEQEEPIY